MTTYGSVNVQGLVHVDNHKVVVPRLGARKFLRIQLGRCLLDAQHGGDVSLLFGGRDVTPDLVSKGYQSPPSYRTWPTIPCGP